MSARARTLALLSLLVCAACDGGPLPAADPAGDAEVPPRTASAARGPTGSARATEASASAPSAAAAPEAASTETEETRRRRFVEAVTRLSEPDAEFFSDNLVSNETSFLHVADELPALAPRGAVYVGVGPEQNFSYIALLRPSLAYVVDIRRDNLRLHLLYKAAFEATGSRSAFLALLLGRDAPSAPDPPDATVEQVLATATSGGASKESFAKAHAVVRARVDAWGLSLQATDLSRLEALHRALFEGQLDLRFSLKSQNGRRYPTLGEMLAATDRAGRARGFLATEEAFQVVRRMQVEHRVIPIVGDFAGDRAMPGLAASLRGEGLAVGTLYVSNVEQYLFEPGVWEKWRRNVAAFPRVEGAVFVRAWLDQGRAHPRQERGHRTATVVASMDRFEAAQRERPYGTWWSVATDGILEVAPAGPEAGQ